MQEKQQVHGYSYRLFSPLGTYPRQSLSGCLGSFFYSNQCIAIATSELAPRQYELKLQAALLLAVNKSQGFIKLYPFPYQHQLITQDNEALLSINQICRDIEAKKSSNFTAVEETIPEFDQYENAKGASLPTILDGTYYNCFDELVDAEKFVALSDVLATFKNEALSLSVSALLSSNQLSCHFQFQQQANLALLDCLWFYLEFRKSFTEVHIDNRALHELAQDLNDGDFRYIKRRLAQKISPKDYFKYYQALLDCMSKDLLA